MPADPTPIIIAIIGVAGTALAGWAAYRKSKDEADKAAAEATGAIVGSAGDVVKMLRENMAEMREQLHEGEHRLSHLEDVVGSWEGWAEKVLDLLDRAIGMLKEEQRARIEEDVRRVKRSRPMVVTPKKEEEHENPV